MIRNIVIILLAVAIFTACGRAPSKYSVTETEYSKAMATNVELAGCKAFYVEVDYRAMNVVRCPNSTTSTTYTVGKSTETIITIDAAKAQLEKIQARDALLNRMSTEEKELLGINGN